MLLQSLVDRAEGQAEASGVPETSGGILLAFLRARVIAADGRGTLERSGTLTPYVRGISVNFRLVGEAALRRRGATERAA